MKAQLSDRLARLLADPGFARAMTAAITKNIDAHGLAPESGPHGTVAFDYGGRHYRLHTESPHPKDSI